MSRSLQSVPSGSYPHPLCNPYGQVPGVGRHQSRARGLLLLGRVLGLCLPLLFLSANSWGEDNFRSYFQQALESYRAHDYDQAIEIMEKARQLRPAHFAVWMGLGDAHRMKGDYLRSIECYSNFLEYLPWTYRGKAYEGLYRRALAYKFSLQLDEAKQGFSDLANNNPEQAQPRFHLGHCFFLMGRYEEALRQFEMFGRLSTPDN